MRASNFLTVVSVSLVWACSGETRDATANGGSASGNSLSPSGMTTGSSSAGGSDMGAGSGQGNSQNAEQSSSGAQTAEGDSVGGQQGLPGASGAQGGASSDSQTAGASGGAQSGSESAAGASMLGGQTENGGTVNGGTPDSTAPGGGDAGGSDNSSTGAAGASMVDETGAQSIFPQGVTAPRIMIVGDSVSAGPGCYKGYLLNDLMDNGYSQFEFVGEYADDCGSSVRHSAVSCSTSADFTKPTFSVPNCFDGEFPGMSTLVSSHDPDLIMIQLGVNDVWGGNANIDSILNNYTTLVEQARAHNPNVVLVVAQIHKIITDNCTNSASTTNAQELVNAVPGWAQQTTTDASPVFVADLWTNSDPMEADDCVHPNDAGAERMGMNWFNALKELLPKD